MGTDYYALGLCVGLVVAIALFMILRLVQKRKNEDKEGVHYDERQMAVRGIAWRNGMFTLMAYNAVFAILDLSGIVWCETYVGLFLGILIAAAVFVFTAIHKDAYLAINNNMKSWTAMSVLIIAANLLSGVVGISHRGLLTDGKLSASSLSLMIAVLWALILVVQTVHNRNNDEIEAEDEP